MSRGPADNDLAFGEAPIGLRHLHHGTVLFPSLYIGMSHVAVDLNALTPLEALRLLDDWKRRFK